MSPNSASGCITISLQAKARITLLPVTVSGTQAIVLTSAMSTDVKNVASPCDLVKGAGARRDFQDQNRPPVLAAGLALQREGRVLHVPKHDVVHRAGERDVAGQGNVGQPLGSRRADPGRIPQRALGRRIGAQGGRRRQAHQEGRHRLQQRSQAFHQQWAFFLVPNWSARSGSKRSLINSATRQLYRRQKTAVKLGHVARSLKCCGLRLTRE